MINYIFSLAERTAMRLFAVILASLLSVPAFAADFTDGDFKFSVNSDGTTCTVTGTTLESGDLNIPATATDPATSTTYNVTAIGKWAFNGCSGFTGSLTIGENVQTIGDHAFWGCSGFTGSLTIGNNVQTIGKYAFQECSGFTGSLTIGNNVQTIGDYAFFRCSGFIGSLTIGDNVQTIGKLAFDGCSGFTGSLTIPSSVQTIDDQAFLGCSGFTGSLTIGDNVQTIGDYAFYKCSGFIGSLEIGDNVQTIGKYAFYDCSGFTGSLTIGKSVHTIGESAFRRCYGFNGKLIIPNALESIGGLAFSQCSGFTGQLTLPNSLQTIGEFAFYDCNGFTGALIIPESVKEIGAGCFSGCHKISSLTISSSNTMIYYQAFQCFGLQVITCLAPTPPQCIYENIGNHYDYVFGFQNYSCPLYVPKESVNLYQTAIEWKKFTNIIPVLFDVAGITLNKTALELTIGQSEILTVSITPDNATDKSVTWSSSDEVVATVNATGLVTAVAAGSATITATTSNGLTATCAVTVTAKQSGIEGVEGDSAGVRVDGNAIIAPEGSKVYDLSGREVTPTSLTPGIYIVRIPGGKAVKVRI